MLFEFAEDNTCAPEIKLDLMAYAVSEGSGQPVHSPRGRANKSRETIN